MLVLAAIPGAASDTSEASLAAASAVQAEIAGQDVGQQFEAMFNGTTMVTEGIRNPEIPMIGDMKLVAAGALSQDAVANAYYSAACAGLVGGGGELRVGAEGNCITEANGTVQISLGTLPELGLDDLLSKLPEAPELPDLGLGLPDLTSDTLTDALPDAELLITGRAITARCIATHNGTAASSVLGDAQLVAMVDGKPVVLGKITKEGLSLTQQELLGKLQEVLPDQAQTLVSKLGDVLAKLPTDQLPTTESIISVETNQQSTTEDGIEVTALHVRLGAPALPTANLPTDQLPATPSIDLRIGHVTCSPPGSMVVSSDGKAQSSGGDTSASSDANGTTQPVPQDNAIQQLRDQLAQIVQTLGSLSLI